MRVLTEVETSVVSGRAAGDAQELRNAAECTMAAVTTGVAVATGQIWFAALAYLVSLAICSAGAEENMNNRLRSGEMDGVEMTAASLADFIESSGGLDGPLPRRLPRDEYTLFAT